MFKTYVVLWNTLWCFVLWNRNLKYLFCLNTLLSSLCRYCFHSGSALVCMCGVFHEVHQGWKRPPKSSSTTIYLPPIFFHLATSLSITSKLVWEQEGFQFRHIFLLSPIVYSKSRLNPTSATQVKTMQRHYYFFFFNWAIDNCSHGRIMNSSIVCTCIYYVFHCIATCGDSQWKIGFEMFLWCFDAVLYICSRSWSLGVVCRDV